MSDGLLIYDADCGFCTRAAQFLARKGVAVAPLQAQNLDEFGLTEEQALAEIHFVSAIEQRSLAAGADAIARALQTGDGPIAPLGQVLGLPGVVHAARPIYRLIARNRERLPGGTPACRVDV